MLPKEKITSTTEINWRQFGPGMAGYNEELWCHPTDKNTILMGPDMHVTYGSWDYGASWQTVKDCDGTGYDMERVIEVQFSRQDPDFAIAIDREGYVNFSNDRGRTWTATTDLGKCHSELAVDPTDDNKWYIGAGDFFNVKDTHRSEATPHGTIQTRSEYGFIWKSVDKGKTWKKITAGLPDQVDIGKIIVDPSNPKRLIAATGHGIYLSDNEGLKWYKGGEGLPNNLPRDLTSHYDSKSKKLTLYLVEQTVYTADGKGGTDSSGGVFKSTDSGKSWSSVTGNLALDLRQITSFNTLSRYYRTISYWFGLDLKQQFKAAKERFPNKPTNALTVFNRIRVNPNNVNEIYVTQNIKHDFSFAPSEVWKTTDGGESWIAVTRVGTYWNEVENKVNDMIYWKSRNNPTNPNMTFAHLHGSLYNKDYIQGNRHMEIDCEGNIYCAFDQQTVRSEDGGATWNQIDDYESEPGSGVWISRGDSDLPGRQIILDTGVEGRVLLCSGEHGLWMTDDIGSYPDKEAIGVRQIEGQINDDGKYHSCAHSIATAAVHPNNPDEIYILMFRQAHRGHFRVTKDGGKTWENYSKPIDYSHPNESAMNVHQASLMVDPKDPNNIYFCANLNPITEVGGGGGVRSEGDYYGIYKSYDGGHTWDHQNTGIPANASILRLAMDPKNPNKIYAASNRFKKQEGALYVTENRGNTWKTLPLPNGVRSVNNVSVNPKSGDIYISCGERTATEPCRGGAWVSKNGGKSWTLLFDADYVWQVESSRLDPNIICVVSAGLRPMGVRKSAILNPGAYITRDGGASWVKANRGLGQPDKITDFRPDISDKNTFWCSLWGSGSYKAVIK